MFHIPKEPTLFPEYISFWFNAKLTEEISFASAVACLGARVYLGYTNLLDRKNLRQEGDPY